MISTKSMLKNMWWQFTNQDKHIIVLRFGGRYEDTEIEISLEDAPTVRVLCEQIGITDYLDSGRNADARICLPQEIGRIPIDEPIYDRRVLEILVYTGIS